MRAKGQEVEEKEGGAHSFWTYLPRRGAAGGLGVENFEQRRDVGRRWRIEGCGWRSPLVLCFRARRPTPHHDHPYPPLLKTLWYMLGVVVGGMGGQGWMAKAARLPTHPLITPPPKEERRDPHTPNPTTHSPLLLLTHPHHPPTHHTTQETRRRLGHPLLQFPQSGNHGTSSSSSSSSPHPCMHEWMNTPALPTHHHKHSHPSTHAHVPHTHKHCLRNLPTPTHPTHPPTHPPTPPQQQQTKGTSSFGKRHTKTHTGCRRCGRITFHKQKKACGSCGFPEAKLRKCKYLSGWVGGLWVGGWVGGWSSCLSF